MGSRSDLTSICSVLLRQPFDKVYIATKHNLYRIYQECNVDRVARCQTDQIHPLFKELYIDNPTLKIILRLYSVCITTDNSATYTVLPDGQKIRHNLNLQ